MLRHGRGRPPGGPPLLLPRHGPPGGRALPAGQPNEKVSTRQLQWGNSNLSRRFPFSLLPRPLRFGRAGAPVPPVPESVPFAVTETPSKGCDSQRRGIVENVGGGRGKLCGAWCVRLVGADLRAARCKPSRRTASMSALVVGVEQTGGTGAPARPCAKEEYGTRHPSAFHPRMDGRGARPPSGGPAKLYAGLGTGRVERWRSTRMNRSFSLSGFSPACGRRPRRGRGGRLCG